MAGNLLNGSMPADKDLDLDQDISSLSLDSDMIVRSVDTNNNDRERTNFFDLPRELRDEVYGYALPCDSFQAVRRRKKRPRQKIDSFRIIWKLPKIYYALPLLRSEICEAYYRTNQFKVTVELAAGSDFFLKWVSQAGRSFTQHVSRLKVRFIHWKPTFYGEAHVVLDVCVTPDRTLKVLLSNGHGEDHHRSYCTCDVEEVLGRILRQSAKYDQLCKSRLDNSERFGPVIRFILQFVEVHRLDQVDYVRMSRPRLYKWRCDALMVAAKIAGARGFSCAVGLRELHSRFRGPPHVVSDILSEERLNGKICKSCGNERWPLSWLNSSIWGHWQKGWTEPVSMLSRRVDGVKFCTFI